MSEPSGKVRRMFRFSLRTLLVAIAIISVWLGLKVNDARRQKEAVKAIPKQQGSVWYDWEMIDNPGFPGNVMLASTLPLDAIIANASAKVTGAPLVPVPNAPDPKPPGPKWLRDWIGAEYFQDAYQVSVGSHSMAESDFAQLANLPTMRNLFLTRLELKDAETGRLRKLRDSDLAFLKTLKNLQNLDLDSTEIEGSSLAPLAASGHLNRLTIKNSPLNDAGMQFVGDLSSLKDVTIDGCPITDAGLKPLNQLRNLQRHCFGNVDLTINGLLQLSHLRQVKLFIYHTRFTAEEVARIQKEFPNALIGVQ